MEVMTASQAAPSADTPRAATEHPSPKEPQKLDTPRQDMVDQEIRYGWEHLACKQMDGTPGPDTPRAATEHYRHIWDAAAATEHNTESTSASERRLAAYGANALIWDAAAATEHNTESASASERHLAADAAAATEHSNESTNALIWDAISVQITVASAISGEQIFAPLRMLRRHNTSALLRQLQHIAYTEHQTACIIQLTFNGCIIQPSRPLWQYYAATEHVDVKSQPKLVFKMIAQPLLLTWEQLRTMPAMRKRAGRGGKAACQKQRELRVFCLENNIDELDLATSAYNWRLLLKTMPCLNTPNVIGPGIVGFSFRLLGDFDPNYMAEYHVFELMVANGDRWHLHFHQRGNCHRRYLPFEW